MANGFFQGGFAQGFDQSRARGQTDRELGLRERALGVEEEGARLGRQRTGRLDAQKVVKDSLTEAAKVYAGALEAGKSPEEARKLAIPLVRDVTQNPLTLRAAGTDPIRVESTFNALIGSIGTPANIAETEARAGAQATGAAAEETADLANLTGEDRQDFILSQLIPKETKGEFLTLLNALNDAPVGSPEHEFIRARINKLTASGETGFTIEVGENGDVRITQGPAGIPKKQQISGNELSDLRGAGAAVTSGRTMITGLLEQIESDPSLVGAVGSARRFGETVSGVTEDLANAGLSVLGIDPKAFKSFFDRIISFEGEKGTGKNVLDGLAPTTTRATDVFSKALRYSVARSLQPTGRLLASTIETAGDMTDFTGLKSATQVKDSLTALDALLATKEAAISRQIEQGVTGTAKTSVVPPTLSGSNRSTPPKVIRFDDKGNRIE